jgi:DNA modification methylase
MKTKHEIIFGDSRNMSSISDNSVDLILTSPPYPMIEMWDELFITQNPLINEALSSNDGNLAFELMHNELNKVWSESYRVLKDGGYACINIGDAIRTLNKNFQLYPSHAKVLLSCKEIGFNILPGIIWRKQTNSPTKFMGSGMLPPGAYVTLESEHILLLRKSKKREFTSEAEKINRRKSAFFWEERNQWFSDSWDKLKGSRQAISSDNLRSRSAAYPLELSYRLINMFSVQGDTVLDPYLGTGTTTLGAIASGRDSIGMELDESFKPHIHERIQENKKSIKIYTQKRVKSHLDFIKQNDSPNNSFKYMNTQYSFPVKTSQEIGLVIPILEDVTLSSDGVYVATYSDKKDFY